MTDEESRCPKRETKKSGRGSSHDPSVFGLTHSRCRRTHAHCAHSTHNACRLPSARPRARAPAATAAAAAALRRALLAVRARPRLRVAPPDHVLPLWYFLRPTKAYETDRVSTIRFFYGCCFFFL